MTTSPELSGTEIALRHPETAAATVLVAHAGGGDVRNAWDVLASAWSPGEAAEFVITASHEPRFATVDVAALLRDFGIGHVVTVTLDSSGYGRDTWACSCGVRNAASWGMFPTGDHITDGTQAVVDYVLDETED